MNVHQSVGTIAALLLGGLTLGCNQRTQDLYRLEVERSCQDCDLRGINLANQSLGSKYRVSVSNTPLSTAPQGLGKAEAVNLTGSDLSQANFRNANLTAVLFNDARLNGADLSGANLSDAQLVAAELQGANLQHANLQGANFQNADLTGADLRGVDLSVAHWDGADLTNARLDSAPTHD